MLLRRAGLTASAGLSCSLTPRGLAALHVRLLSEIHSTQAWLFISLVLHGK